MRKVLATAILAGSLAAGGIAMAADSTGVVKSWDAKTHTLTLQDGKAFILPSSYAKSSAFKAGEKVTISYDMKDGKNMATMAKAAS